MATKKIQMTEMSKSVYDYLHAQGRVSVEELAAALGRTPRSVNANINDLVKKTVAVRIKEDVEGADKPVTYVELVPDADAIVASWATVEE